MLHWRDEQEEKDPVERDKPEEETEGEGKAERGRTLLRSYPLGSEPRVQRV